MKKQAPPKVEIVKSTKHQEECLTALPPRIDIAALAALYNSPTRSPIAHEYLLEEARTALAKYELAQADLELAADSLARATHMLVEQHGLEKLPPEQMAALERDVLEWYGLCPQRTDMKSGSKPKLANAPANVGKKSMAKHASEPYTRKIGPARPSTYYSQRHGTSLSH